MHNSPDKNDSIKCSVKECAYHCGNQDYCSLSNIQVGSHEMYPTQHQATDCESFKLGKS